MFYYDNKFTTNALRCLESRIILRQPSPQKKNTEGNEQIRAGYDTLGKTPIL